MNVPHLLSQIQKQYYGIVNKNEHKDITLRFLPLTIGFINLPNITIADNISNKKFHLVTNNKLLISNNNNNNNN